MTPGKYNFTVFRGTTHRMRLTLKQDGAAWDLTGYTATLVVNSAGVTLTSSPAAGITITPTTGIIDIAMSPTDTNKIYNSHHYVLTVTSGDTYAVLHGTVTGELP